MPMEVFVNDENGCHKEIMPTEEEIREQYKEKFDNTIWKNKVNGKMVRVSSGGKYMIPKNDMCYYEYKVFFQALDEFATSMDMREFEYLYERVGKCKYTNEELEKMLWEVE